MSNYEHELLSGEGSAIDPIRIDDPQNPQPSNPVGLMVVIAVALVATMYMGYRVLEWIVGVLA